MARHSGCNPQHSHLILRQNDYFDQLRQNRTLIIELFWDLIAPEIKEKLETIKPPCIGVHVRMGDFRALKVGEDFAKVGSVRTPENYFVDRFGKLNTAAKKGKRN